MGTVKNDDGATLSYKVIGISKEMPSRSTTANNKTVAGGGFDRPVNKINAFTEKGIKWIEDNLSRANPYRSTSL